MTQLIIKTNYNNVNNNRDRKALNNDQNPHSKHYR